MYSVKVRRQGRILAPPQGHDWWASHAQLPTVQINPGGPWRVYFSGRDKHGKSHILYADIDPDHGFRLITLHDQPILDLGLQDAFDDAGTVPCSVLERDGTTFLYYIGISLKSDVPPQAAIGLCSSPIGKALFSRVTNGPVLGVGPLDPYLVTSAFVERHNGAYRMWCVSGTEWAQIDGRCEPFYHIVDASSDDGVNWMRSPVPVLTLKHAEDEGGLARPSVFHDVDGTHMIYCRRKRSDFRDGAGSYRLGYAFRPHDGQWQRLDQNIAFENPPVPGDWDYNMQAYPIVVPHDGGWAMLYNGNGFGQTGIGWASLSFSKVV